MQRAGTDLSAKTPLSAAIEVALAGTQHSDLLFGVTIRRLDFYTHWFAQLALSSGKIIVTLRDASTMRNLIGVTDIEGISPPFATALTDRRRHFLLFPTRPPAAKTHLPRSNTSLPRLRSN